MEKEIILKFLKGEMSFEEFVKLLDDNMFNYIESLYQQILSDDLLKAKYMDEYPRWDFDRYPVFKKNLDWSLSLDDVFMKKFSLYSNLYRLFKFFNEKIEYYDKYEYNYYFALDFISQCLLSSETSLLFEPIIEKIPRDLPKAKKKQIIKDYINQTFDLSKKPYWAQESEWPVRNGKPCRYIDKKKEGEKVTYYFETIDTKEIVEVEQYY